MSETVRGYAEVAADLRASVQWYTAMGDNAEAIHAAAELLAGVAAALPDCPTCDGTQNLELRGGQLMSCPDCDHGKVTVEQLVATWQAVHDDAGGRAAYSQGATVPLKAKAAGWDECIDHLRSVRPPSPKEGT